MEFLKHNLYIMEELKFEDGIGDVTFSLNDYNELNICVFDEIEFNWHSKNITKENVIELKDYLEHVLKIMASNV